jgi:hypothetical protein
MGSTIKTFDASGIAPNGKLYSGDLNAIQAAKADSTDFAQTIALGTLQIGDSGISIVKYGTGEARLTSRLRLDGAVLPGTYTTTQRDAISSPPKGLILFNSTNNRLEINSGTTGTPVWTPWSPVTRASTPPSSPVDGDYWIYSGIADMAWVFRYNASGSTYKWEFVGGSPYLSGSTESFTLPNPGALVTGATDGAKFTAPRSGVYQIEYGVHSVYSSINAAVMVWALQVNAVDGDQARRDTTGSSIPWGGGMATVNATLASSQIARMRYNYVLDGSGGFAVFVNPYVKVTPIRVS